LGKPFPEAKAGEGKFNRRFSRWLFTRPFLGGIVAPLFIWGLSHSTKNPQEFQSAGESLGFTAFMAGLLAKSVLDLVKTCSRTPSSHDVPYLSDRSYNAVVMQ
jgi:hypothetical protein